MMTFMSVFSIVGRAGEFHKLFGQAGDRRKALFVAWTVRKRSCKEKQHW